MVSIKDLIVGGVVTVIIGGSAYTVSQTDIVNNFAADTGMSQEAAKEYVSGVKDEDLVAFDKLGEGYIESGQDMIKNADTIDCSSYEYEWESYTLSCSEGKSQLIKLGNDEISLGQAYVKLNSKSALDSDISLAIQRIDTVNSDYDLPITSKIFDQKTITDNKNTCSYNKSLLKAALDGK